MSISQLQQSIADLTPAERKVVERVIDRLRSPPSPVRARRLGRELRAMDEGQRTTLDAIKRQRGSR